MPNDQPRLMNMKTWWDGHSWPVFTFFATRLGLFLLAYIGLIVLPVLTGDGLWRAFPHNLFLDGWSRWDSGWYVDIAQNGYSDQLHNVYLNVAFFPLYPMLMKGLQFLVGNYHIAGLIVSNLAMLFACVFLYDLISEKFDEGVAKKSLLLLLVNPFSFFFDAVYTESLFLLLTVLVFVFGTRKKWLAASACVALAGATRMVGVLLILPLIVLYLESIQYKLRSIRSNILWLFLGAVGISGYMLFLGIRFNDPLLFLKSLYAPGWKEGINLFSALDVIRISTSWQALKSGGFPFIYLFHILACVLGLSILIVSRKKLPASWLVWGFATFLVSLPGWNSLARYILVIFPLYTGTVLLFKEKGFHFVLYFNTLLLSFFTLLFTHWYWVG